MQVRLVRKLLLYPCSENRNNREGRESRQIEVSMLADPIRVKNRLATSAHRDTLQRMISQVCAVRNSQIKNTHQADGETVTTRSLVFFLDLLADFRNIGTPELLETF